MSDPYAELRAYREMLMADGENLWHASTIATDLDIILSDLDDADRN